MNATPAVGDVAAIAAHNERKEIGTTLLTVIAPGTLPIMFMRNGYIRSRNRNSCGGDCRKRASEVVLIPLRARASLPLKAAEVAELVCAAASR